MRFAAPGTMLAPPYFAGDFILTHGPALVNKLIRFGQAFEFRGDQRIYAYWNHAAVVVDGHGNIVQALTHGVSDGNVNDYIDMPVAYVHVQQSDEDRAEAVAFAEHALGQEYGFVTIVSVALHALTGGKLVFGIDGTEICSGLVARCLERGPTIFEHHDPTNIVPAELARHFDVRVPTTW